MADFNTVDGYDVTIDSIHIEETYCGSLEGIPDDEEERQRILRQADRMWGKRAVYFDFPFGEDLDDCVFYVYLKSYKAVSYESSDGSEFVLIFLTHRDLDRPLRQIIWEKLSQLKWRECADDFYF